MISTPGDGGSPRPKWREYPDLNLDPVLGAAVEAFNEVGYHGSTVRDIANRAGLSVAGIYHYHAGKQDMLFSILKVTMCDLGWRSLAALEEAGNDPIDRFSLLIESLALYHTHRRDLAAIGASEMRSLTPGNRKNIAQVRTAEQRLVDKEVERASESGVFRTRFPHEASRAVVTMCTALPNWFRPTGSQTAEAIALRYVELSLDMMGYRRT